MTIQENPYLSYAPVKDESFYQGKRDYKKSRKKVSAVILRAGQNNYKDKTFDETWSGYKYWLPRGAYWFYDWRSTGLPVSYQGELFALILGSDPGEIVPTMDFELPWSGWTTETFPSRKNALNIMQAFKQATGFKRMMLYINVSTLKTLQPFPDWLLADWDLWIAAPPLVEDPITKKWRYVKSVSEIPYYTTTQRYFSPVTFGWEPKFWQYTFKLPGPEYGAESLDLDGDLYMGTEAELYKEIGFKRPRYPYVIKKEIEAIKNRIIRKARNGEIK